MTITLYTLLIAALIAAPAIADRYGVMAFGHALWLGFVIVLLGFFPLRVLGGIQELRNASTAGIDHVANLLTRWRIASQRLLAAQLQRNGFAADDTLGFAAKFLLSVPLICLGLILGASEAGLMQDFFLGQEAAATGPLKRLSAIVTSYAEPELLYPLAVIAISIAKPLSIWWLGLGSGGEPGRAEALVRPMTRHAMTLAFALSLAVAGCLLAHTLINDRGPAPAETAVDFENIDLGLAAAMLDGTVSGPEDSAADEPEPPDQRYLLWAIGLLRFAVVLALAATLAPLAYVVANVLPVAAVVVLPLLRVSAEAILGLLRGFVNFLATTLSVAVILVCSVLVLGTGPLARRLPFCDAPDEFFARFGNRNRDGANAATLLDTGTDTPPYDPPAATPDVGPNEPQNSSGVRDSEMEELQAGRDDQPAPQQRSWSPLE